MAEHTLTCIIPTHDRPELLTQALESVQAQEGDNGILAEVIVVADDGSDESKAVALDSRWSRVPVRFVARPAGGGASASRNLGADLATSSHFAFLDDDDYWLPGYAQAVHSALNNASALALSSMLVNDGASAGSRIVKSENLTLRRAFQFGSPVTGSTLVVSREAFYMAGGFDANLRVLNDTDFFVRALQAGVFFEPVSEPLVAIRSHAGPQLTDVSLRRAHGMQAFFDKHRESMTRSERRGYRYRMHRMFRRSSPSAWDRLFHGAAQALTISPPRIKEHLQYRFGRESRH